LSSTFFQEDKNFSKGDFGPCYPLFTGLLKKRLSVLQASFACNNFTVQKSSLLKDSQA